MSSDPVVAVAEPAKAPANADIGMRTLAEMLAGLGLYGGLGWLGDRFFGTSWLLPAGLLLGFGLSIYMVIRRYGRAFGATKAGGDA